MKLRERERAVLQLGRGGARGGRGGAPPPPPPRARIRSTRRTGAVGGRCIGTIGMVHPGTLLHRRQRGIPVHSYENRSQLRALQVGLGRIVASHDRPSTPYVKCGTSCVVSMKYEAWISCCHISSSTPGLPRDTEIWYRGVGSSEYLSSI